MLTEVVFDTVPWPRHSSTAIFDEEGSDYIRFAGGQARPRDGHGAAGAAGRLHGEHAGTGWIYVAVDDPDAHYYRAKAAGAEVPALT